MIPTSTLEKPRIGITLGDLNGIGPEVVAAAGSARRMIIGFLRARLPAGSPGAYTPAELAALARIRRSQAAFAPYE